MEPLKNTKDINVYKEAISAQQLKSLCEQSYKDFSTPLQQTRDCITKIQSLKQPLCNLEVTKEEWLNIDDNKVYKDIAKKYSNKLLKNSNKSTKK